MFTCNHAVIEPAVTPATPNPTALNTKGAATVDVTPTAVAATAVDSVSKI